MNTDIFTTRSNVKTRHASRPRTSAQRKSRVFRPTAEGMEQRLQLTAQAVGTVAAENLVQNNPPLAPPVMAPEADLAVESLNVQSLGNNLYKVTATVENVPPVSVVHADLVTVTGPVAIPGVTYPGGGALTITRTDGGTSISMPSSGTVQDTPDPVQYLTSMPIPALNPGQTIQLSTVTTGRAIFTASIGPTFSAIGRPLPFPEANPANDSMTVDNLVSHTLPINTATLGLVPALTNAVQGAQFHLDSNGSSVVIPGIVNYQFKIPAQSVSVGVGPFSYSASYTVNNLVSTSAALSYEQGGLAITVNFADNSHALHTTSSIFPDVSVTNLQMKIVLPLSYDASGQYFNFTKPQVTVTGNWNATGLLGPVFDLLLPNINAEIASGVTSALQPELGLMAFQLNQQIHDLVAGGRIVSADIQQDQAFITVETPS